MKRLRPSHEPVIDNLPLLVRLQLAVFRGDLLPQFFKTQLHRLRICRRIGVMDGHFVEPAVQEFSFHGRGGGVRQKSLLRLDAQHPQSGLLPRDENVKVERMFGRPSYQFLRSVPPSQSKGRLNDPLGVDGRARESEQHGGQKKRGFAAWLGGKDVHPGSLPRARRFRKPRTTARRGFALIEATMAMSLLSVTGLLLLKLSLNVIHPRQYSLQQVLSDSYLTVERSLAERLPFEDLVSNTSLWPMYPETATTQNVYMGKLPGGKSVYGTLTRTRMPDAENYPIDGGTGTVAINPAAMKIWRVQSIIRYKISDRTYLKSRTVVRSQ